jgi:hypothetical protein
MKKLLTTTTASHSLAPPGARRLLRVRSGAYAGRLVALLHTAPHELYIAWADPPYEVWSTPQLAVDDLADQGIDALMTDAGDIQIIYTEWASSFIRTVRMVFAEGAWSGGTPVVVCNAGLATGPSIARDSSGAMWAAFVMLDGPFRFLHVKRSIDDGATWGSGPADEGTVLTSGVSQVDAKLLSGANATCLVYTQLNTELVMRSCETGDNAWSEAYVVVSDPVVDEHFDAAVSPGGMLGIVYDSGDLRYREFNGVNWSTIAVIDANGGSYPQLRFEGEVPVVFYLSEFAADQRLLTYSHRRTGAFSLPETVDPQTGVFDAVVLYNQSSASYANLTSEAADAAPADVVHPDSSALMAHLGDAVYLGRDKRFRLVRVDLSTAGSGGATAASYFDGSQWRSFTPTTGNCEFSASTQLVVLFQDDEDLPDDWQRTTVNGQLRYWVRLVVTSPYATPPVGSRITAIGDVQAVQVGR